MISGAREWTGLLTYLLPLVSGAPVDWTWFGQSAIGVQYLAASARAVSSRRPPAPSHAFRERARSDCASSGSPAGGGTRAPPGPATSPQRPRPASNHDQMWRCSLPGQTDASPSPRRNAPQSVPPLIRTRTCAAAPLYFDRSATTIITSVYR